MDFKSEKHVSFTPSPGAYLTIAGHDDAPSLGRDGCSNSGLRVKCSDGIHGGSGWQGLSHQGSMLSKYIGGSGENWREPCKSILKSGPTTLQESTKIAMNGSRFAFRIRTDVTCLIATPNFVDSVFYNGINLSAVVFWGKMGVVTFTPVAGAYLVVNGHTDKPRSFDECKTDEITIQCSNGVNASSDWDSVGSDEPLGDEQASGVGGGWDIPCEDELAEDLAPLKLGVNHKFFAFRHRIHHAEEYAQVLAEHSSSAPGHHYEDEDIQPEQRTGSRFTMIELWGTFAVFMCWYFNKRHQRKVQLRTHDVLLG